jgi:hypothetical protein
MGGEREEGEKGSEGVRKVKRGAASFIVRLIVYFGQGDSPWPGQGRWFDALDSAVYQWPGSHALA